jgi:hypothetical protein
MKRDLGSRETLALRREVSGGGGRRFPLKANLIEVCPDEMTDGYKSEIVDMIIALSRNEAVCLSSNIRDLPLLLLLLLLLQAIFVNTPCNIELQVKEPKSHLVGTES